jgi:hypothetical protein
VGGRQEETTWCRGCLLGFQGTASEPEAGEGASSRGETGRGLEKPGLGLLEGWALSKYHQPSWKQEKSILALKEILAKQGSPHLKM